MTIEMEKMPTEMLLEIFQYIPYKLPLINTCIAFRNTILTHEFSLFIQNEYELFNESFDLQKFTRKISLCVFLNSKPCDLSLFLINILQIVAYTVKSLVWYCKVDSETQHKNFDDFLPFKLKSINYFKLNNIESETNRCVIYFLLANCQIMSLHLNIMIKTCDTYKNVDNTRKCDSVDFNSKFLPTHGKKITCFKTKGYCSQCLNKIIFYCQNIKILKLNFEKIEDNVFSKFFDLKRLTILKFSLTASQISLLVLLNRINFDVLSIGLIETLTEENYVNRDALDTFFYTIKLHINTKHLKLNFSKKYEKVEPVNVFCVSKHMKILQKYANLTLKLYAKNIDNKKLANLVQNLSNLRKLNLYELSSCPSVIFNPHLDFNINLKYFNIQNNSCSLKFLDLNLGNNSIIKMIINKNESENYLHKNCGVYMTNKRIFSESVKFIKTKCKIETCVSLLKLTQNLQGLVYCAINKKPNKCEFMTNKDYFNNRLEKIEFVNLNNVKDTSLSLFNDQKFIHKYRYVNFDIRKCLFIRNEQYWLEKTLPRTIFLNFCNDRVECVEKTHLPFSPHNSRICHTHKNVEH